MLTNHIHITGKKGVKKPNSRGRHIWKPPLSSLLFLSSLSPLSILLCAVHFGFVVAGAAPPPPSHHEAVIKMEQDPNLRRLLTHDDQPAAWQKG